MGSEPRRATTAPAEMARQIYSTSFKYSRHPRLKARRLHFGETIFSSAASSTRPNIDAVLFFVQKIYPAGEWAPPEKRSST